MTKLSWSTRPKSIEDELLDKIICRLEYKPSSLDVPSWSYGTMFVRFGWFKKVTIWHGISPNIEGVSLSRENGIKLRAAVDRASIRATLKRI
jgi:hypothetical protein